MESLDNKARAAAVWAIPVLFSSSLVVAAAHKRKQAFELAVVAWPGRRLFN